MGASEIALHRAVVRPTEMQHVFRIIAEDVVNQERHFSFVGAAPVLAIRLSPAARFTGELVRIECALSAALAFSRLMSGSAHILIPWAACRGQHPRRIPKRGESAAALMPVAWWLGIQERSANAWNRAKQR